MDVPNRIDWRTISEIEFNRIVEALLVRHHQKPPSERAYALDGRGGDDGIDIAVEHDGQISHIYQLKYFPEGFSGGHGRSRKPQIKHSFERAVETSSPSDWTLVIPRNATLKELQFLTTLRGEHNVRIHFLGVSELDGLLAAQRDLAQYFARDSLVDTLRSFNQEKAALANSTDLPERLLNLSELANSRSVYWGVNIGVQNGIATQELYAKRPDAHVHEPIKITINALLNDHSEPSGAAFQLALDYGVLDTVTLPTSVLIGAQFEGPVGFVPNSDAALESVELRAVESGHASVSVELRRIAPRGERDVLLSGRTLRVASGRIGTTVETSFLDCLKITWRLANPDEQARHVHTEFAFEITNASVSNVAAVLRFIKRMLPGSEYELWLQSKKLLGFPFESQKFHWSDKSEEQRLFEFIEDLEYLEEELDLRFALVEAPTLGDIVSARFCRMMLEGKYAAVPHSNTTSAVADTSNPEQFLKAISNPMAQFADRSDFDVPVLGQEIRLPTIRIYHPNVSAQNVEELTAQLKAGKRTGLEVEFASTDGTAFRAFLPERWPNPGVTPVPEPWRIFGVDEDQAVASGK